MTSPPLPSTDPAKTRRAGPRVGAGVAVLMALAAVACGRAASAPAPPAAGQAPALAELAGYVCRPVFQQDGHPSRAGTAFPILAPAFNDRAVLLTAHHLFGMASKAGGGMAWQDAPRRIRGASCRSLDGARTWTTGPATAIAGVHAIFAVAELDDIAALPITAGPPRMLALAAAEAAPGDTVWLAAQTADTLYPNDVLHPARVVANHGYLAYVYQEPGLMLANTSGGAIVDRDGKVVGVNVGVGHLPNGATYGVGDNLATVEGALLAARGR